MFFKKAVIKGLSSIMGIRPYMMRMAMKVFWYDFRNEKRVSFRQKVWAYKRGFTSANMIDYGLNEGNYKVYLSDWDYYKMFPLNNNYVSWINDKLTTKYILSKYNEYQPQYYYYLQKNKVLTTMDSPETENLSGSSIMKLLKEKGRLAFKQETGSLGEGFYKVEFVDDIFYVNGEVSSEEELIELINSLDGYLVTEFILAHKDIDKVYPGIANSIRLMVIKDGNKPSQLSNAFIRFGSDETKGVDNASAGGLFSIIDIKNGAFEKGHRIVNGELEHFDVHPDTMVSIKGTLPDWEPIIAKVLEISDYIGQLSWMGFDVVITDDGFKILEINSHQDIKWYQHFYPLLEDNPASEFLNKKLKEKSNSQ